MIDHGPHDSSAARDEAARLDDAIPDLDWTVLPAGASRSHISAPSGDLASISVGNPDDPWVVLVPGVTGSKEDFSLMLPLIAGSGYYVETFDMAGQYESADAGPANLAPPRQHYDHALFVGDLLAVLERAPGPAHVLGYSFAGTVAQLAFAERPDLFASLTLLSAPPEPGQGFRGVKRIGWLSGLTGGRIGAALMIWGVRENFTKVPPGRLRFVRDRFSLTSRESVRDIIRLMKKAPDVRPVLAAAKMPKFVAVGEHDLWPLALHARFAEEIGARIGVYRTGHSPCETTPHQLSRDLVELYASAGV
ncbi:MAG: alpha/beta hydrolase [Rhodoglobus sp.]